MANAAEKRDALLHILSVNSSLFKFPGETFKKLLPKYIPGGKAKVDSAIKKYKEGAKKKRDALKATALRVSPLSIGLYNATVDTGSPIDIRSILNKVKSEGLVSEDGIKVTEFVIRYGKFQTAVKYTSEYGLQGNESKPFVSADFKLKITSGGETKGASFSYYASGKIRFSGGHLHSLKEQPKELIAFFSKHYHKIPTKTFTLNNVTSEFKLGFPLKTSLIYYLFSDEQIKSYFKDYHVVANYDNFLYLKFSDKFSLVVADSGVIQIQGTTDVDEAYAVSIDFFTKLKDNDFLRVDEPLNIRLSPKKTKIARRKNNMPAPNVTRRGTTCPVGRRPDPYSYEGVCPLKDKCFIKPNPQGQPCCYTKPKSIAYSRNKVENAYLKAGVRIPNSVRQFFGIGTETVNRPVNVANTSAKLNIRVHNNKINSRQCLRYTKVALVDIATRLKIKIPTTLSTIAMYNIIKKTGIEMKKEKNEYTKSELMNIWTSKKLIERAAERKIELPPLKLTKPILCDLIKKSAPANKGNGAKVGNKLVSGTNATLRLGGRLCRTYARVTLEKIAKTLGVKNVQSLDKSELCKEIEKAKNVNSGSSNKAGPAPKSPSRSSNKAGPAPKSPSRSSNKAGPAPRSPPRSPPRARAPIPMRPGVRSTRVRKVVESPPKVTKNSNSPEFISDWVKFFEQRRRKQER